LVVGGYLFGGDNSAWVDELRINFSSCPANDEDDLLYIESGDFADGFAVPTVPHGSPTYRMAYSYLSFSRDNYAAATSRIDISRDQKWYDAQSRIDAKRDNYADAASIVDVRRDNYAAATARIDIDRDQKWFDAQSRLDSHRDHYAAASARLDIQRGQLWAVAQSYLSMQRDQLARAALSILDLRRSHYAAAQSRIDISRDQKWEDAYSYLSASRNNFCETGVLLVLRNAATRAEVERKFVNSSTTTWTRDALAAGSYEIEAHPQRYAWEYCRATSVISFSVAADGSISGLFPVPIDLAISYVEGDTRVSFAVPPGPQAASVDRLAVWYSATYPIVTTGTPDGIILLRGLPAVGRRAFDHEQSGAEYCAIRCGASTGYGVPAEIYLPDIGSVVDSPLRQRAETAT
jgi:hypothetical protein